MPVNLIHIQKKLTSFSSQAKAHHQRVVSRLETLQTRLIENANRLDELKEMVNREAETNPRLRCAVPVSEPLNAVVPVGKPARSGHAGCGGRLADQPFTPCSGAIFRDQRWRCDHGPRVG